MKHRSDNATVISWQSFINAAISCSFLALLCLTAAGCSRGGPKPANPKACYPVTGTVLVNGEPKPGLKIKLSPEPLPPDRKVPLPTVGRCDSEGRFALTTYYQNDGAPVGKYRLLFSLDMNPAGASVDYFQGRYSSPFGPAEHTLNVTGEEESVDMGVIELEGPQ